MNKRQIPERFRTIDDTGPDGYWGRREAGKKIWGPERGDMQFKKRKLSQGFIPPSKLMQTIFMGHANV